MDSLGVNALRHSLILLLWSGLLLGGGACVEPLVLVVLPAGESEASGDGSEEGEVTIGMESVETGIDTGTGGTSGIDMGTADTGADSGESESGEAEAVCGNGTVEAGEDCDDGVETATCNANCTLAQCGDGIVNGPLGEQCDAGGASALCDDNCTLAACGDGLANETAGEECDGDDLAGQSCQSLGFVVGSLACGAGCRYDVTACYLLPDEPVLQLSFTQVKRFDFTWGAVGGAEYYRLEESMAAGEPFVQLGGDIFGDSVSHEMPLHFRWQASYRLLACNVADDCTSSAVVDVMPALVDAVGYVKASNTDNSDQFGFGLALSGDGSTLAVGAPQERSFATGIDGNQFDDSAESAGAVYVFERDGLGAWSQHAYIKASNTDPYDQFGYSVALSEDGNTLAVGAIGENSNATGINGNQADESLGAAGAAYLFTRDGMGAWSQQAYVKASNTGSSDQFGYSVALSGDGDTLAVSAPSEDSIATGVDGNQVDNTAPSAGAVYIFVHGGMGNWSQQAYIKASNSDSSDQFGGNVSLSYDGSTLAISAPNEDSSAIGIDGNQADDSLSSAGAVYVFIRNGMGTWSQQAYTKASNTEAGDLFGSSVSLSGDGNTLAVGAIGEDSVTVGINGNQANNGSSDSGAVYVIVRDLTGVWSQQAYIKVSSNAQDSFGASVALSADGSILVVGATLEDSNAIGIEGDQFNDALGNSGSAYLFVRDGMGVWSQESYIKASNTGSSDQFGRSVSLSGDGDILAVGAATEDSIATGIGGDQASNSASSSGAVYLY